MFYDKSKSEKEPFHVFDFASLLANLFSLPENEGLTAFYTKEEFPKLAKVEYHSEDGENHLFFVKEFRDVSMHFFLRGEYKKMNRTIRGWAF